MNVGWKTVVGPVLEPVTLGEAKSQVRQDGSEDDALLRALIPAARGAAEEYLGRALLTQSIVYRQDEWTDEIVLPRAAPLQVASVVVKYHDAHGVLQTLDPSAYVIDDMAEPARVVRAAGQSWPALQSRPGAVVISYDAGWEAPTEVPSAICWAIRLMVASHYAQREDLVTGTIVANTGAAQALLAPWRVFWAPPQ